MFGTMTATWLVYEPAALESELRGRIVGNSEVESPEASRRVNGRLV